MQPIAPKLRTVLFILIVALTCTPRTAHAGPSTQQLPPAKTDHVDVRIQFTADDVTINFQRIDFWDDYLVFVGTATGSGTACLSRDDFTLYLGATAYRAADRTQTRAAYDINAPGTGFFTQCISRGETEVLLVPFIALADDRKARLTFEDAAVDLPGPLRSLDQLGTAPIPTATFTPTPTYTPSPTPTPTFTPAPAFTVAAGAARTSLARPADAVTIDVAGSVANGDLRFDLERMDIWTALPNGDTPGNAVFLVFTGRLIPAPGASPCVGGDDVKLHVDGTIYPMDDMRAARRFYDSDFPGYILPQCISSGDPEPTFFVFDVPMPRGIVDLRFRDAILRVDLPLADYIPTPTPVPTATATRTPQPAAMPANTPLPAAQADRAPITAVIWNIELNDADPAVIAAQIGFIDGVDLWGLAEVNRVETSTQFEAAAEEGENADFGHVLGASGGGDRLLALYDADRFALVDSWELDHINTTGNARAPLVLHLQERAGGLEFLFMVNHLYRSRDDERHTQAQLLNDWAREQTLPVIAAGDYNFDWDVNNGDVNHDRGYDLMTADDVWEWERPEDLVTTQCSDWPCRYESVLDFVFTAGPARDWLAVSEIVTWEGDFPDTPLSSDHRPVAATFWPGQVEPPDSTAASTALPTFTPAPTAPAALPADVRGDEGLTLALSTAAQDANLRAGPGTNYARVGLVQTGDSMEVVGRNEAGDWLQLAGGAWIAAWLVNDPPATLPPVTPPPPPATVPPATVPPATVPSTDTPVPTPDEPTPTPTVPPPPPAQVVIEYIFYDGVVSRVESDEYAVIANLGGTPVNLGGWRLNADDPGQDFWFPGVELAPGQRVRVYTNEVHSEWGGFSFGNGQALWNNTDRECGRLYDASGTEVSRYCY